MPVSVDSLVSARDGKGSGVKENVLSTLLNEMDGITVSNNVSIKSGNKIKEGQEVEKVRQHQFHG